MLARALAVVVLGILVLGGLDMRGWLPDWLTAEGPLEGGGGGLSGLTHPADTGAVWGLTLQNLSRFDIVVDSVVLGPQTGRLTTLGTPYVWDVTGAPSLMAWSLPLPAEWTRLPIHVLDGYVIEGTSRERRAVAEVVFEFGVPERASGFTTVTVSYHMGWLHYRKTFPSEYLLCPPSDPHPCGH